MLATDVLKDFSMSLLQPGPYLRKLTKTIFFNWRLPGFVLKILCSRQVPHVASHPGSLYPGISDLSIWVRHLGPLEASDHFWESQGCSSTAYTINLEDFGTHPACQLSPRCPRCPAILSTDRSSGTPLPHVPGVRMTWVKQTPSN